MTNDKNYWCVIHDTRWAVQREGNQAPTAVYDTQDEAWEETKRLARETKGEAFLQDQNGTIRERNTYGHDPRGTPG